MNSLRALSTVFVLASFGVVPGVTHAQEGTAPERLVADVAVTPATDSAAAMQPAGPAPTPEHTGIKALLSDLYDDIKHLPSVPNAWLLTGGGAAALAVHPADHDVTPYLKDASWSHNVFGFGAVLGQTPTLLAASVTVYTVGRTKHLGKVSHFGMDLIQSIALSQMMTMPLKYTVRRERPDGSGKGSFPSGHASDTFAFATAFERHLGWKGAVPAYVFASYVAASRLHDNRHFLSDVVFGATVGTIAGRTVTRPGHQLPVAVAPIPGGVAIVYTRRGE